MEIEKAKLILFIFFAWTKSAQIKTLQKKRSFYAQADRKGWPMPPPPYGQAVVIFSK